MLASTEVLLRSELHDARLRLDRARRTYVAATDARSRLVRAQGGAQSNVFAWCRNLPDVWPGHAMHGTTPPWPPEPIEQFAWLVTGPADLWCPTAAEQDDRYWCSPKASPTPGEPV